jgi:nicotinate phosphoribosyltransferase
MNTSADAPYLDCAYKLQEYDGQPRRKRSEGKATWPGRKQVYRRTTPDDKFESDLLTLVGENAPESALLKPVVRGGRLAEPLPTLAESRAHAARQLAALPQPLRSLDPSEPYPVRIAPALRALAAEADAGN